MMDISTLAEKSIQYTSRKRRVRYLRRGGERRRRRLWSASSADETDVDVASETHSCISHTTQETTTPRTGTFVLVSNNDQNNNHNMHNNVLASMKTTTTTTSITATTANSLAEVQQRLCKRARLRNYETTCLSKDGEGPVFFLSTPALYIYSCVTTALLLQQAAVLYGVLLVITLQCGWIALKWLLYIGDDPAWRQSYKFVMGWIKVLIRQSERIRDQQSRQALWLTGTVVGQLPVGFGMARVILRHKTKEINGKVVQELKRQTSHFRKRRPTGS